MKPGLFTRSCCTTPAAMFFWGAMFALIYSAGLLLRSAWPGAQPFGDTLILVALGAACLINYGWNRTLHCGITAPLFIVGSLAAALIEAGVWQFDMAILWAGVLLGVGIAFVVEWWTVGRHGDSTASPS